MHQALYTCVYVAYIGFAINLKLLLSKPSAHFDIDAKIGHLEDSLLMDLITIDQLEAKADDCSKVLLPVVLALWVDHANSLAHLSLNQWVLHDMLI